MLLREPSTTYVVYPSWAKFTYRWKNLWPLLASPLTSGHCDPRTNWRRFGYPDVPQPFRLIDGPAGGGIISVQAAPTEKCMAFVLLGQEASVTKPEGDLHAVESGGNVFYLDPNDGPLAGVSFAPAALSRRAKRYVCAVSVEHADSARASVYWVVGFKREGKALKGLGEMPAWAESFGLKAPPLAAVPEALRAETAPWFVDPAYDYAWFDVESDDGGVGFHYAVMVYLAFELRRVAGPRMFSMNLVADIEDRPNARHLWHRK